MAIQLDAQIATNIAILLQKNYIFGAINRPHSFTTSELQDITGIISGFNYFINYLAHAITSTSQKDYNLEW
jgi:hypothetical protein